VQVGERARSTVTTVIIPPARVEVKDFFEPARSPGLLRRRLTDRRRGPSPGRRPLRERPGRGAIRAGRRPGRGECGPDAPARRSEERGPQLGRTGPPRARRPAPRLRLSGIGAIELSQGTATELVEVVAGREPSPRAPPQRRPSPLGPPLLGGVTFLGAVPAGSRGRAPHGLPARPTPATARPARTSPRRDDEGRHAPDLPIGLSRPLRSGDRALSAARADCGLASAVARCITTREGP
jgi:hypothetical protein